MPATIITSPAIHSELFAILDGGRIDFTKTGEYYLVAADWCEERGLDAIAAGLRALARRGRRPLYGGAGDWLWHREYRVLYYERDYSHHAPGAAFDAMVAAAPDWAALAWAYSLTFHTFHEAVLALAHVWKE